MLNTAIYERTHILVGDVGVGALQRANVFLCGAGGVGGHCAEALVRAGVGKITVCDHDVISSTNKNRQLIALDSTIGKSKVQALCARLRDINVNCCVTAMDAFVLPCDVEEVLTSEPFTHVVDCIDSVDCKVALLEGAVRLGLKVFSSCGAGGRLDPSLVGVGDLFDTENDALARICRNELRRRGVRPGDITVVHSTEKGLPPLEPQRQDSGGRDRAINGTISYMPPLFGLLLSSAVVREILDPSGYAKARQKRQRELLQKEAEKAKLGQWKGPSSSTSHLSGGGNAVHAASAVKPQKEGNKNNGNADNNNNKGKGQQSAAAKGCAPQKSQSQPTMTAEERAAALKLKKEKKAAACAAYFADKKKREEEGEVGAEAKNKENGKEEGSSTACNAGGLVVAKDECIAVPSDSAILEKKDSLRE